MIFGYVECLEFEIRAVFLIWDTHSVLNLRYAQCFECEMRTVFWIWDTRGVLNLRYAQYFEFEISTVFWIWGNIWIFSKPPYRIYLSTFLIKGTAVAQWLRCCSTNWKVAGSITAGVTGIFHWYKNPSDRSMALGSTQPLTEMSTRSISWG